jgi:leucyl-tRNA synthetase
MAYYIIAKYINNRMISPDNVSDSFFDYVLLGTGNTEQASKESNVPLETMEQIRNEFRYFYPIDSRHSGRDLVPNHLTFFIFNHVAIFTRENWPQKIVVNGSILMGGKKMSKSLGNIIPLRAAIHEHGADTIRLAMLVSAEILQDADFSFDTVRGIRSKLLGIFEMAARCVATKQDVLGHAELEDRWLTSRLQRAIAETMTSMDRLRMREAIHYILFSLDEDLQWYMKRAAAKARGMASGSVLAEFLNVRVRMLAPFAPFTAEEVWERMGHKQSITIAGWPTVREDKIDLVAEESEFLISSLLADLQNIVKVTKITPSKIVIYTSADWKVHIYRTLIAIVFEGKTNFGDIMRQLIANPENAKAKTEPRLVQKMIEDILSTPLEARNRRLKMKEFGEVPAILDAVSFLSAELNNAQIVVCAEEETSKYDPKSKARSARPFKPAVYLE